MELEDIYENIEKEDIKDTCEPQTQSRCQDEGKARKQRGSRCLVLITVSLGLICVLLLVFIILQHITITAERDLIKSYKNTVKEFNQTINSLQDNYTDLMTEKHQLQNNFSSLSQKNLELETRVKDLTAEKNQLQSNFNSLSQKKLELETEIRKLSDQGKGRLFMSTEAKSWSDSRQYCRDCGADLVIINTQEKQLVSSLVKEIVWIGLSDIQQEGYMKWVDNSPLKQGFWEKNEPNDAAGNEDCIELNPAKPVLKNWNDIPCSDKRKCICDN
ncbi:CD209 antigen-like protein C isoform X2 [Onychostoma macrolepis]|uniref:CD209 antigen-like protein C isoform X2 n=1 Tax=Onychostoma macrolepis TaxID=369639 RepID=UPI00272AEF53|nr:CD209 antigen-like protein C isoform X2 [Onychostoma macrolepis]